ncbi:MAG: DUF4430 domain-containing protein [Actinomycetota bacterium]|nr:DUF4430 domain-containing protein [Actinomycetota bacterium]
MHNRHTFPAAAVFVSSLALTLAPAAVATSTPKVTVRIEGKSRTLLGATTVQTRSGSITKGGAPSGACPASSAQGALNVATKGRWSGKFDSNLKSYFVTKILGDTESGKKAFWELLVNDLPAQSGFCAAKLHSGDRVLFAVVGASGAAAAPIRVTAPRIAVVGQSVTVKAVYYNTKGKAKPLSGATLKVGSHTAQTGSAGAVSFTPTHTGTIKVAASKTGYIRDEASVRVMGSA